MIQVVAGATYAATASNFASGFAGTIGLTVYTNSGGTSTARSTTNVVELVAGSGIYEKRSITAPAAGYYALVWDDGSGGYAVEDLIVT